MRKAIRVQEQKEVKSSGPAEPSTTPLPQYLLDRGKENSAKSLSSAIKNKRNEKVAKFSVPLPKVKGISEEEMFKVVKTGAKTKKKGWKRMITKPTFGMNLQIHLFHYLLANEGLCLVLSIKNSVPYANTINLHSRTRLHAPAREIRALHPAHGVAV